MSDFLNTKKTFLERIERIQQLSETVAILQWDLRTGAPAKGVSQRSKVIGSLSTDIFRLSTGNDMAADLTILESVDSWNELNEVEKALVRDSRKEYNRYRKIPEDIYRAYVELTSEAESAWEGYREGNDFAGFSDYLKKIVDYNKQFIEMWGSGEHPYDALLDYYEPGMTVKQLDGIFAVVRTRTVELLKRIVAGEKVVSDELFFEHSYATWKQEELSLLMLEAIGFSMEAGRLDESEHPFTSGVSSPYDVRLTTKYHERNLSSALLSTLHEGGHGLYEQNVSEMLAGTTLATGTSMGIHESQSRFFENVIGRSEAFWKAHFVGVQKAFPNEMNGVTPSDFYMALNKVAPSLIRIEADELTYNLHIMVRYEIEKGLFDGTITVEELPKVWNEKMKEYLGIEPDDDRDGVLQDVHWAAGLFGYFPSYSLGNMYSAQFLNRMKKEIPNMFQLIERNEIGPIKDWMVEKVHRYGKMKQPGDIILEATGEPLNSKYLMDYLEEKFTKVYEL